MRANIFRDGYIELFFLGNINYNESFFILPLTQFLIAYGRSEETHKRLFEIDNIDSLNKAKKATENVARAHTTANLQFVYKEVFRDFYGTGQQIHVYLYLT